MYKILIFFVQDGAHTLQRFRTDDMLDMAGIMIGGRLIQREDGHQEFFNQRMPVLDFYRAAATFFCQINVAICFLLDKPSFLEHTHGTGDTRLGKTQLVGDINSAHRTIPHTK